MAKNIILELCDEFDKVDQKNDLYSQDQKQIKN